MTQRGSVLMAVVWILALLAIFTLVVSRRASAELLMGRWFRERVLTRLLAQNGIERALFEIQADPFLTFDSWNESWGSNEAVFKETAFGSGTFTVICELPDESLKEKGEAGQLLYGACDEAGRININTASEEILKNLLRIADRDLDDKEAHAIAQAIVDWRDPDDNPLSEGAESIFYRASKNAYEPRNGPFESVEELLMVRGIDRLLFGKLQPYVSVYTDGKVNFNTASIGTLQALGLSEPLARKVDAFRRGSDGKAGTKDDEVFQHVDGITPALSVANSFSPEEFAQISNVIAQGLVSVTSDAFRIQSIGRFIRSGEVVETNLLAIAKRDGTILYWKEGKE